MPELPAIRAVKESAVDRVAVAAGSIPAERGAAFAAFIACIRIACIHRIAVLLLVPVSALAAARSVTGLSMPTGSRVRHAC
ncbi:hypothetical protein [Yinghuangia sp. YIM S09857]|uniref:hypothetical protein n=1 Tax=Yinghuangia sp. YIM S09857 TaxID=3436929 RepID=UPI003F52D198